MAQVSAEKLEQTGHAEKERMASLPQGEQLASMLEPPLPIGKGTEPSVLSTRSQGEESQGGREQHLGERGRSEQEHGVERVNSTVKEGRFRGGEGGQAKRVFLGEVEGYMSK